MHRYQSNLTDLLAGNLNSEVIVGSNLSLYEDVVCKVSFLSITYGL